MLYIASGDGGSANDPQNNAQNLGTLLGKLLRITPSGSIPADNPFVADPNARGEIWAYGLRNPWRFSFDRQTGTLWLGDVGQGDFEEIDIIRRGGNYGWRVYEGNRSNINPGNLPPSAFDEPVYTYGRSLGRSVTGGYVYRGSLLPSLVGAYFYADFSTGLVWALVHDGTQVLSNTHVATLSSPASFGEDRDGEIYVCSFDGGIYGFEETAGGGPQLPALLSETGLFIDTANLLPQAGLIEYEVNSPRWSDGARTRQWLALPGLTTIDFEATAFWGFPGRHRHRATSRPGPGAGCGAAPGNTRAGGAGDGSGRVHLQMERRANGRGPAGGRDHGNLHGHGPDRARRRAPAGLVLSRADRLRAVPLRSCPRHPDRAAQPRVRLSRPHGQPAARLEPHRSFRSRHWQPLGLRRASRSGGPVGARHGACALLPGRQLRRVPLPPAARHPSTSICGSTRRSIR